MSFLLRGFDGTLSQRVYWSSTALDDSQYAGPGPISDLVVMEVEAAGSAGAYSPPERWAQVNVAASQTAVALSAQVSGNSNTIRMVSAGSIVGLSTQLTEAITAGTLTVTVTKNGSPMTLSIVHTSGSGSQATLAAGINTYVAGDLIGIQLTTDAGFLPVTTDIEAWILCSEAVSGSVSLTGNYSPPEQWSAVAIPASASNATMSAQVDTTSDTVAMMRAGNVTGLAVKLSAPVTTGTVTVRVTKNGTPGTAQLVLTAGQSIGNVTQSAPDDAYIANDLIGLVYSTSGDFTPVGSLDIEAWLQVSEAAVVSGGGGGGGGTPEWTAGSYTVGQTVTRGPYVWRANGTTNEDPMIVEGNLGLNTDWTFQTAGTPGTTQTPGAADGAPNGNILLINNFNGSQATAYRQSVNTGVLGMMLVVDLKITGSADSFYWGMFDSSLAQTSPVPAGLTGFYGVEVDIYDPSTAQIAAIANGARVGTPQSYSNANATNAGSSFSRWYLKTTQNGANWDIDVYRPARIAALFPYTAFNVNQEDDLALIARFTNVARPSFSTWRFLIGGHTGGAAMIVAVRGAYVRNWLSGNWTALSKLPTGI